MKPFSLCCLVVFLFVAVASSATAQTSGENRRAAAEVLFIEGRRLVAEGYTAEGCAKFAESQALDPGVGTLLNLARCYERMGRTASAWTTYREAASRAQAAGQFERESTARAAGERLASGIPMVKIARPSTSVPKGLTLTLDGEPWSHGFPSVPLPVDPGRHELVLRAPGFEPFSTSFEAKSGDTTVVRVTALRAVPKATVVRPPPDSGEPWRTTHTFAVANGVLAVTATAVGTVLVVEAGDNYDDSKDHCRGDQCYPRGLALREDAFDRAQAATVAFGVAGAAVVSAAVLWFTGRPPDRLPWQSATTLVRVGSTPRLEVAW